MTMKKCGRAWLFCVAAVAACVACAQDRAIPDGRSDVSAAAGVARPQRTREEVDRTLRVLQVLADPETTRELNVTDEQKEGLKKRMSALRERQAVVDKALWSAAAEQMTLAAKVMADKQAPTNALMDLVVKIGSLRTEQAKIQTEKMLAIRDTLSVEQIRGANEILQKYPERIRERIANARRPAGMRGSRHGGNPKGAPTPPQRPEGWEE
jgi:hypothetical protein